MLVVLPPVNSEHRTKFESCETHDLWLVSPDFSSQKNGAHVKVIPKLDVPYLKCIYINPTCTQALLIMTSFKGYDIENRRVKNNIESRCSRLKVSFMHSTFDSCIPRIFKSIFKDEHIDSTLTLLFPTPLAYPLMTSYFKNS